MRNDVIRRGPSPGARDYRSKHSKSARFSTSYVRQLNPNRYGAQTGASYNRVSSHQLSLPTHGAVQLPSSRVGMGLLGSIYNIKVRLALYLLAIAVLAAVNVTIVILQTVPSLVAVPLLGGLAMAVFLGVSFAVLLLKGNRA